MKNTPRLRACRDLTAQLNVKNFTDKLSREGSDGFFDRSRIIYLRLSTRL